MAAVYFWGYMTEALAIMAGIGWININNPSLPQLPPPPPGF